MTNPGGEADALLGGVVGHRYRIVNELSSDDPTAVIYQAIDTERDRIVAVRFFDVQTQESGESSEQLLMSLRAASALRHSNLARILHVGIHGAEKLPFAVIEIADGVPLSILLERFGRMRPQRVWDLLLPALEALEHVHDRGLVHGDLRPANMLVVRPASKDEWLLLQAFGNAFLAPAYSSPRRVTAKDPRYQPPETGVSRSPAADVYQLTLVLLEALTGAPPVNHPTPIANLLAHQRGDLGIPFALENGPLGPLLHRALERDPKHRLPNARALRMALRAIDPTTIQTVSTSGTRLPAISAAQLAQWQEKPDTDKNKRVSAGLWEANGSETSLQSAPEAHGIEQRLPSTAQTDEE